MTNPLDPAWKLARSIRDKEISSRELLQAYLDRIDRLNPQVNAVVTLDAAPAMDAAAAADQVIASGGEVGPLHGLPITIKDAIETAGIRSTGGARELIDYVPEADAPSVSRLKAAGAIVFGKTNLPRWSADLQTFNDIFGTTNNPWDTTKTTGGSSGGPAAAVATGLTAFELGTDIAGSVRIPSGYCGVFGHKPSFGIVSQRGYLDRLRARTPDHVDSGLNGPDINVFGPIARSAEDLDLLLDVLAGPDHEKATAWSIRLPPPRHTDLAGYRIGSWLDDPACPVDSECVSLIAEAATRLAGAGAKVSDARPPVDLVSTFALFNDLLLSAVSLNIDNPETGDVLSGSHRKWLQLDEQRTRLRAIWAEWFKEFDLLICPILPMPPFDHDHAGNLGGRTVVINGVARPHVETLVWTGLVGVNYLPSTAVPVGRTPSGLPVGAQLVAPYLEDRTSIFVAQQLSDVLGGFEPPPLAR